MAAGSSTRLRNPVPAARVLSVLDTGGKLARWLPMLLPARGPSEVFPWHPECVLDSCPSRYVWAASFRAQARNHRVTALRTGCLSCSTAARLLDFWGARVTLLATSPSSAGLPIVPMDRDKLPHEGRLETWPGCGPVDDLHSLHSLERQAHLWVGSACCQCFQPFQQPSPLSTSAFSLSWLHGRLLVLVWEPHSPLVPACTQLVGNSECLLFLGPVLPPT